jgi:hypothetical protein
LTEAPAADFQSDAGVLFSAAGADKLMNRLIKVLINVVLAILAVTLTLGVLFFMNPSWQKSLLENFLAKDPVRQWQVGSVHILPTKVEVLELFVLEGTAGAGIRILEMNGPFWKMPLTGVAEVESGRVSGLQADLSRMSVGDLTSEDYQSFLSRVSGDEEFWKERLSLVLSKLSSAGLRLKLRDVEVSGELIMPGDHVIPVNWLILEADSDAPRLIRLKARSEGKAL